MLRVVQFSQTTTLRNALIYKLIKNELHIQIYCTVGKALLQSKSQVFLALENVLLNS